MFLDWKVEEKQLCDFCCFVLGDESVLEAALILVLVVWKIACNMNIGSYSVTLCCEKRCPLVFGGEHELSCP